MQGARDTNGPFGRDTANGGMDKLGHAYATYVVADVFTEAILASLPLLGGPD